MGKRIFNAYACDNLARIQVLGQDPICSTFRGGSNNESIPESDTGFVFNSKCGCDFRWSRFNAPNGIAGHYESRRILGNRGCNFSRDVDIELLQDLHTHSTGSQAPELAENIFCDFMFYAGVDSRGRKSEHLYRRMF